jgi:hypothetical protein
MPSDQLFDLVAEIRSVSDSKLLANEIAVRRFEIKKPALTSEVIIVSIYLNPILPTGQYHVTIAFRFRLPVHAQ